MKFIFFGFLLFVRVAESRGQNATSNNFIRLGDLSSSEITYANLNGTLTLTCLRTGCAIKRFELLLLPKGSDMYGPYTINGAVVPEHVKKNITKLQAERKPFKMLFESITVDCDGTTRNAADVVYNVM